ncbi:bifunctional riboflavin kinase/FAD synthetase [Ginsengibacter hankyongi]|uniref:Riboflavin biosynthesis protein n=1 Tax=Ginsengibacter hankyongi TaxID=2607284 RepID=A0A5J5IJQ8_9BACT|nr:bifunctional riboflavin kinase/FAD synthetase [Ginsengibacter hankyongi]KAA9038605.1 bifunctional riboflavin kinase/FAD synthetase [Ginsengibacter hankyongi]
MRVHRDINNLPLFKNAVITIGTFDGVHTGHLQIINQLKKEAGLVDGETVIITFHPHPRMIITKPDGSKTAIKLLNTLSEKIELLQKQNIDHLVIVPFTVEFSEQTAEEYIKNFLVEKFHPHSIIIGYDHRFGNKRQGDYKLLEAYQSIFNFKVKEIPEHVLHHIIISSTKIRHALEEKDINTANEYLGYTYFFEGKVVEGNKLGRTLGYPTANIEVTNQNKLIPANGVYAVELEIDTILQDNSIVQRTSNMPHLKGMMNIGTRPTVGGTKTVIEVNIFDFDQTIYDQNIRVYVKYFLRDEVKFDGLEALKEQLAIDKINTLQVLNKN